ncbi:isoprenylcysteine carboxylmethyltransferase family protein [uncultured Lutibacter sp.]|uniref:methyltransferase family protein n=1 Tax=uncultured Lutibacter sp. TaxID=437739 RepID=UPI002630CBEE|nr:isoprenylcysteine carboxylmethyltransferase family protein [uncultured Lutibacter sp.]
MIEKIYLGLILVFFIIAFAIRNIKTFLSTKQSITGKSIKLTISIFISTFIYLLILLRLIILEPKWVLEIELLKYSLLKTIGFVFIFVGFVTGILALVAMKNSWRVGIKYDQKTNLVTKGIYKISRNPYFLSYDILIFGYILIFPSIILIVLYLILVVVFHKMILEEEEYLQKIHNTKYIDYKKRVNRYLTTFINN